MANGCGGRVWLHEYKGGTGWSYCISPHAQFASIPNSFSNPYGVLRVRQSGSLLTIRATRIFTGTVGYGHDTQAGSMSGAAASPCSPPRQAPAELAFAAHLGAYGVGGSIAARLDYTLVRGGCQPGLSAALCRQLTSGSSA